MLIIDSLSNRLIHLHGSIKLHLISELLLIIIITLLMHLHCFKIGAFLFVGLSVFEMAYFCWLKVWYFSGGLSHPVGCVPGFYILHNICDHTYCCK